MLDCRNIQIKLADHVDGDLSPSTQRVLEAHLQQCPDCEIVWHEYRAFLQNCDEFMVYPEPAYPFAALQRRMADIEPLEEIIAFLPKLQINHMIPRFAVAIIVMLITGTLPATFQGTRQAFTAIRSPYLHHAATLESVYEDDFSSIGETKPVPPDNSLVSEEIRPA